MGRQEFLSVFGNDYETADGTGALLWIDGLELSYGSGGLRAHPLSPQVLGITSMLWIWPRDTSLL